MTPHPHDSAPGSQAGSPAGALARSAIGRFSRILGASSRMQATGKFLRRSVWAWPILAAVIFGAAGWSVHRVVENAMREQRAAELNVMADAGVAAVEAWMTEQRKIAELYAQDEQIQALVDELLQAADAATKDIASKDPAAKDPADVERRLVQSPAQSALRARLKPRLASTRHVGYFIVSPLGVVVAADQDAAVGKQLTGYRQEIFARAAAGKPLVSKPFPSPLLLLDEHGELRTNLPTMFTIATLRDGTERGGAALGLRIRPEEQFTRILETVRYGDSGETYAFDGTGLLLSESRFDDQLKQIGLLVDRPDARSILTVEVRDPGVNMAAGERPALRRPEQPLTRMAADAVQGHNRVDADGLSRLPRRPEGRRVALA